MVRLYARFPLLMSRRGGTKLPRLWEEIVLASLDLRAFPLRRQVVELSCGHRHTLQRQRCSQNLMEPGRAMGWKVVPTPHGAGRFGRAGVGTNKLSSTGSKENGGAGIYLFCPSAGGSCRTFFLILQGEPTSDSLTALRWADAAQRPATPYHAGGIEGYLCLARGPRCRWHASP